jgi:hypothetical protein
MEAVRSSETSLFMYLTARGHIPEDSKHHIVKTFTTSNITPANKKFESHIISRIQNVYRLKTYDTRLRLIITTQSVSWIWWAWVHPKCSTFFFQLHVVFNSEVLYCISIFTSRFYILLCLYRPRTAHAATSRARKNVFQDCRQRFWASVKNFFPPPPQ